MPQTVSSYIVAATIAFDAVQAMLAVVAAANPQTLGLDPKVVAWVAIVNVGIGIVQNRLNALGK